MRHALLLPSCALLTALAASGHAQPMFAGLGDLPGSSFRSLATAVSAENRQDSGIQQQCSGSTERRGQIDHAAEIQCIQTRDLGETAVATVRSAARSDRSEVACDVVRPDNDGAAVTDGAGVGTEPHARADVGSICVLDGRIASLKRTADKDLAAASAAAGVDDGVADQADILAQDVDGAAIAVRIAARIERAAVDRVTGAAAQSNDAAGIVDAPRLNQA